MAAATVAFAAQGQFLTLHYTWADEGRPQDGLLVLGYEAGQTALKAYWIDSWHMSDKFMFCTGPLEAAGVVSVSGAYAAQPGPDWGWRIVVEPQANDSWRMVMYNITPEGQEVLAVEAHFTRPA